MPKEVKVVVPVPCKAAEPIRPSYRYAPPYIDIFDATRDLLGDREVGLAYEGELRIALEACRNLKTETVAVRPIDEK